MRDFIRTHVVGLLAIFVAISGTAIALPGKNKVDSGDIKNAQVKAKDLAADAVDAAKVADNSLTGADIDESSLSGLGGGPTPPFGPAGGDLAGSYPNPSVKETALDLGGALGGTAANATVNEAALTLGGDLAGTVANATVNEPTLGLGGELSGTVAAAQIPPGIIGPVKLGDGAVVGGPGGDVQDGSLTGADVQNNSLGPDDIDETNLNAATVNGLEVRSVTGGVNLNGATFSVQCITDPANGTVATIDSSVDNSKAYVEISGTEFDSEFDPDFDAAEPGKTVVTGAAGATDSGTARAYFLNGTTNEVVSVEVAWHANFASCPTVQVIGRAIG